jgi:hypothetical protein
MGQDPSLHFYPKKGFFYKLSRPHKEVGCYVYSSPFAALQRFSQPPRSAGARFCVNLQQIRQYTCDFMRKFSRTGALFYKKATAQRCAVSQLVISPNNAIGLRQISCIFCIVLPQRLKKINTVVNWK